MAQFDVHRNTGTQKSVIPYVVIVQSSRFDRARRRVIVPLLLESTLPTTDERLNPMFEIEGKRVVLNPLHMVSMAVDRLGEHVGSLKDDGDRVIAALDLLITRAWD
jgi:toxin CcdB